MRWVRCSWRFKPIEADNVVKGIKQADGDYVVLSAEQIKAAFPQTTQTIEIEAFVKASEIDFILLEKPYYLEPIGKGEKVYALLREAMLAAGVIGIARVVMHTKEHLAALVPSGAAMVLNTIRWASEIRPIEDLKLPPAGDSSMGLKPAELKMAAQLIKDMTMPWTPQEYTDKFSVSIQALVDQKVASGDIESVTPLAEDRDAGGTSNVVDLTELLAKSLAKRTPERGSPAKQATPARATSPHKAPTKRAAQAAKRKQA